MYPRFSDLINDWFGTHITLPIQSYGFFVAMAFLVAAVVLKFELKRKEKEGLIKPSTKRIKTGAATTSELIVQGLWGFLIGFKFVGMFFSWEQVTDDPASFLISWQGSWFWGIIITTVSVVYLWYTKRNKKTEEKEIIIHAYQQTGNILIIAAVFGIAGAKLFDTIEHLDAFFRDPLGTLFSFSGLTFYGGLIVAAFAVVFYGEKHSIKWPHMADATAPALMLAYGIGRIGCQVAGDGCWGIVNTATKPQWLSFIPDWLWAYNYPNNVINEGIATSHCLGNHCYVLEQPVFPTPVYETLMALVIFAILWTMRKRIKTPGILFSIYLIFNGIERYLAESIRVNIKYPFMGIEVTQAEIIAVCLILTGIGGILFFRNKFHHQNKTIHDRL